MTQTNLDQSPNQDVRMGHLPSTSSLLLGMIAIGIWVYAMWFGEVPFVEISRPAWKFGLIAAGAILVLWGTRRTVSIAIPAEEVIWQGQYILFVIPISGKRYPFANVRAIDFDHPRSGKLPDGMDGMRALAYESELCYSLWDEGFSFLGGLAAYRIFLITQNRDRILLCAGNYRRTLSLGTYLAKITKSRLT